MDTLIRSARIAADRRRLRAANPDASAFENRGPQEASAREAWRNEIEKQLRAELAAQAQQLYTTERERGYADGHAEGSAAATDAAAKRVEQLCKQLKETIDSTLSALERSHATAWSKLQSSVGEVAFAAVCRLVSSKVVSQAVILQVVEHACARLRSDTSATLRLHPRDIDALTQLLRDAAPRLQLLGLKLLPDESLRLGGCVVESAAGHYDGGLEGQLRRLHAVLTDEAAPEHSSAAAELVASAQV